MIEWARRQRSSSILVSVPRLLGSWFLPLWLSVAPLGVVAYPQEQTEKKAEEPKQDTFFAGIVIETTADKITVSRVVLGKTEKRSFRVTPDTKCEGKLKAKVRVTVRYVVKEDGETAELIIVRSQQKKTTK
jgi:hypothetical protein